MRYALRALFKRPGFTLVIILTLALGIGANTAIFSVVNAVLLQPLPLPDADRLVSLAESRQGQSERAVAHRSLLEWRRRGEAFDGVAAMVWYNANLESGKEPERVVEMQVSEDFFGVMGVTPQLGRKFSAEEYKWGNHRVMILSDELWRRSFGADHGVIDRPIRIHNEVFTVVGVMAPVGRNLDLGFGDLWTPFARSAEAFADLTATRWLQARARLKPGVSLARAQAELNGIERQLEREFPATHAGYSVELRPLRDLVVGEIRPALLLLSGAAGLVLLLVCANVANLSLVRAIERNRELAVRSALGATRAALARLLLMENMLLAAIGAGAGLLLAAVSLRLLPAMQSETLALPRLAEITLNRQSLLFTLALTALVGLLFGLAPMLDLKRLDLNASLKEGGRSGAGPSHRRANRWFVIAEVSVAVVLLAGAGLLLRSFQRLLEIPPGFRAEGVLTAGLYIPETRYKEGGPRAQFYERLLTNLARLPGVESVAAVSELPLRKRFDRNPLFIDGEALPPPGQEPTVSWSAITTDYFRTLEIPLIAGRTLTPQEVWRSSNLAVINQSLAERYWGSADKAIGRRMAENGRDASPKWLTVVGVVAVSKQTSLLSEAEPEVFQPYADHDLPPMSLLIRAKADPLSLAAAVRREVQQLDAQLPVFNVAPLTRLLEDTLAHRRAAMWLLALFAALALLLATVGVYGVMSYAISRRAPELGLRLALGAQRADVMRLVLGESLKLIASGVAIGLTAALALTRLMTGLLYGVSAADPLTFAGVALLLITVALAACFIPARRAAKTDPMIALRTE
jgi:putative ABC transport system permease protein